jgi:hypothetical protein
MWSKWMHKESSLSSACRRASKTGEKGSWDTAEAKYNNFRIQSRTERSSSFDDSANVNNWQGWQSHYGKCIDGRRIHYIVCPIRHSHSPDRSYWWKGWAENIYTKEWSVVDSQQVEIKLQCTDGKTTRKTQVWTMEDMCNRLPIENWNPHKSKFSHLENRKFPTASGRKTQYVSGIRLSWAWSVIGGEDREARRACCPPNAIGLDMCWSCPRS